MLSPNATLPLVWFAAGLALTSATQLRVAGMPLGPGEALLGAWLGTTALMLALSPTRPRAPLPVPLYWFWGLSFVSLVAGFLAVTPRVYEPTKWSIQHDLSAFVFTSAIVLGFAAAGADVARVRRATLLVLGLTVGPLLLLYVLAFRVRSLGPLDLWYGTRFVGWAANPNQLALGLLAAPFVALRLAAAQRGGARAWALALATGAAVVGVASRSDALLLSWAVGCAVLLAVGWSRVALRGVGHVGAALAAYVAVPMLLAAAWVSVGPQLVRRAETVVTEAYRTGGQGADRMRLWGHGIDAIAAAPVFGLGPGSHSGETRADGTSEAHNTLIDWGASAGLVGIAAYVAVLVWASVATLRSGRIVLFAALVALACFSMFHYVLRQPVYWFYLLAIAVLAGDGGRRALRSPAVRAPARAA